MNGPERVSKIPLYGTKSSILKVQLMPSLVEGPPRKHLRACLVKGGSEEVNVVGESQKECPE